MRDVLITNPQARAMIEAAWNSGAKMDWLGFERCLRVMLMDDNTTLAQLDEALAAFTKRGHVRMP